MKVALLYEHPTWSNELLARMRARGLETTAIDVASLRFGLPWIDRSHDLWINRVNTMPSAGRPASVVAATAHFLLSLELRGQRVINGLRTHQIGASKSAQMALYDRVGLATPASRTVHTCEGLIEAAEELGYPVLTKPNIGGSGKGIARYDSAQELRQAAADGAIDLGVDGTGLVQRFVESADDHVHRIEMLGQSLFYATRQPIQPGAFNYCAADGCSTDGASAGIELFDPPPELVDHAAEVMTAAGADVGGAEYVIDVETGRPCFYDFNPYSNFITGFEPDLGFDPLDRYLDAVLDRAW